MEVRIITKLDYTLESLEERKKLVEKILEEQPNITENYLESLADYLILCADKEKRKDMLTENKMITINKREKSFEEMAERLENGEDGIYNFITSDKNILFKPKVMITKKDIEEVPHLRELRSEIEKLERKQGKLTGRAAFILKKTLIEMRREQYLLKESYYQPISAKKLIKSHANIELDEKLIFDEMGNVHAEGVSFMNPVAVSAILQNYSLLKETSWGNFNSDLWALMLDFDALCERALREHPLYDRLIELKIDGLKNTEIKQKIQEEFGIVYTPEYISNIWCKRIPKLIATFAEEEFLEWYYLTQKKSTYKKCNRCGKYKLALHKYFSKNTSSKDGLYSICKECRREKK